MFEFILKAIVSGLIIASISSLSKINDTLSVLLAAFPLTSAIALALIYFETKNVAFVQNLSIKIFLITLPSLSFFVLLKLLTNHMKFIPAMIITTAVVMIICLAYIKIIPILFNSIDFKL